MVETNYDIEKIVEDWVGAGKPSYSTYAQEKYKAAEKGAFPAPETFRKALIKRKHIEERSRKSPSSSTGRRTKAVDDEYIEFLKDNLRDEVKENPELSFMKWKIERLEEENRKLKAKAEEQQE